MKTLWPYLLAMCGLLCLWPLFTAWLGFLAGSGRMPYRLVKVRPGKTVPEEPFTEEPASLGSRLKPRPDRPA